ncbi:MAG: TIGR02449 family protein [Sedimenticola sp.]|nr:MAG: TIGR02449 family protein [Sedimenticola sp.]
MMAMNTEDQTALTDLDLKRLEVRVDELIRTVSLLKEENSSLRTRQDSLMAERADLIEKTEMARTRVESMISRLKSMEGHS